MGKRILIGLGAVVVVIGIGVAVVLGQLGRLIKHGVDTYGPPITGTSVSLGGASVSIFSGEGALKSLEIGNPSGFKTDHAFDLGRVAIAVDPKSLTGEVIHIRSVVVDGASLIAEFNASGGNNLNAILQHVQSTARQTPRPPPRKQAGGTQTKMIIDDFRFTNAEVRAVAEPLQLDRTLKIRNIEEKGLGGKNGATAAEIAEQVLKPVIESAVQAALQEYLKAKGGDLGHKLLDRLVK